MSLLLDALKRAEDAKRGKPADTESSSAANPPEQNESPASASALASSSIAPTRRPAPVELSLEPTEEASTPSAEPLPVGGASRFEALAAEDDPIARAKRQVSARRNTETQNAPKVKPPSPPFSGRGGKKTPSNQTERAEVEDDAIARETSTAQTVVQAQRAAAQNVFDVKQAPTQARPAWILPVVAVVLAVVILGGWMFWKQLSAASRSSLAGPAANQASAPLAPIKPSSIESTPRSGGSVPPSADGTPQEPALPPLLPPELVSPAREIVANPVKRETRAPLVARATRESRPTDNSPVLREFSPERTAPPKLYASSGSGALPVSPGLAQAYAALASGDYARARQLYATQIEANPNNIDVWLGHATATARLGESAIAARSYARVLEIDPSNILARNGLLTLQGGAAPLETESQIRALLARDPNAAALHFALGNALASDKRWSEAQQSYFEAVRLDAKNADYLYNLAVSLDQLRQNSLAIDYYRRALGALASGQRMQFDRQTVERRIAELGRAP
jgi:Tfp pilus assembly protein PilF